jgi:hypothetical protein
VKKGVVRSLISRAKITYHDQNDFNKEIKYIRHDLLLNEHPQQIVDAKMKPGRSDHPASDRIYRATGIIPYVKGISEKFTCIGNRFNVRTIFKTKHALRGTLTKIGPVRDAQQTKQCVYSAPYDCDRCYIGETKRPLEIRIKKHKYNLIQSLFGKSKLAQHAYKEGHKICWKEARVLHIKPNTTYRKYKESVHKSLLDHPISQSSLDISPIWTPVIAAEVFKRNI